MSETGSARLEWIRAVMDEYQGRLIRFAARITGDLDSARDVVQDTFLRLCREDGDKTRDRSTLVEVPLDDRDLTFEGASLDFRFAAAVASFGMVLRDSPYKGQATVDRTLEWAQSSLGGDEGSLRAEFVTLVEKARALVPRR